MVSTCDCGVYWGGIASNYESVGIVCGWGRGRCSFFQMFGLSERFSMCKAGWVEILKKVRSACEACGQFFSFVKKLLNIQNNNDFFLTRNFNEVDFFVAGKAASLSSGVIVPIVITPCEVHNIYPEFRRVSECMFVQVFVSYRFVSCLAVQCTWGD